MAQKRLKLPQNLEQEIRSAKVPFCHIHIFYSKFLSIFKNVKLENKTMYPAENQDYAEQVRLASWLIFIVLSRV